MTKQEKFEAMENQGEKGAIQLADYISMTPRKFPSRWKALLEYRRLQRGQYTSKELNAKIAQVKTKRKERTKEEKDMEK